MIKNNRKQDAPIIKVGITHGDFNGISYEIILRTFLDKRNCQWLNQLLDIIQ